MQQDNKAASTDQVEEGQQQDQTLQWLLEQDYEEQSEKLFALSDQEDAEITLSESELELASRPMSSGDRNLDDLSTVAAEEIVLDDMGPGQDIYAVDHDGVDEPQDSVPRAVEATAHWQEQDGTQASVEDGTDILGLVEEDDMGERFIVLKKGAESEGIAAPGVAGDDLAFDIEDIEDIEIETAAGAEPELEATPPQELPTAYPPTVEPDGGEDGFLVEQAQALSAAGVGEPSGQGPDPVESADDSHPEDDGSVLAYVNARQAPKDDEAFDQFLLDGSHLEEVDAHIDDLVLETADGQPGVDPEPGAEIDYPEDFQAARTSTQGDGPAFALAVAGAMESLSTGVRERLQRLGLEPDAVQVEMMLGSEPNALIRSVEEGFVPLDQMGAGLAVLPEAGEQVYVRLLHSESGRCWNGLMDDDFRPPANDPADESEADHAVAEKASAAPETLDVDDPPSIELVSEAADSGTEEEFDPLGALDQGNDFEALDTDHVDVDAMLESFADLEPDGDVICGIAVDEFSDEASAATTGGGAVVSAAGDTADWCIPGDIEFDRGEGAGGELFADFLDAFIEEAESELEKLEDAVAAWEADPGSEPAFAPVPRILHTLKGIAKGVGLQRYGTFMHNFETLLEGLARPEAGQETLYFQIINAWLDAAVRGFQSIRQQRADVAHALPQPSPAPVGLTDSVEGGVVEGGAVEAEAVEAGAVAAVEAEPAAAVPTPETSAPAAPPEPPSVDSVNRQLSQQRQKSEQQIADEGAKVLAAQQSIRLSPEALDHLMNLTNQTQQLGVRASQATAQSRGSAAELQGRLSSVRAHIAKIADRALANVTAMGNRLGSELDALEMDQYSELQEAANILREGVEDLDDLINLSSRQNAQIEALLKQQASVVSFLGSAIQAARVVPVSRLMPGLRRIVRTVSSDLGKAVQFHVLNEVGSLDRDNHARCQIVLEHMVRNALDHGIESPAERIAAGKPTAGQISIDVRKEGGDYVIELQDDGRGIDPDLMRETAFDKGLDVDVDALSDAEAQRLIFHKGLSTAGAVSEISGRGVGMDIVLSELQHIGGDIDIDSEVGRGTIFRVRIPSNMTLNGALLVSAGKVPYAIPLDGLVAVEHVTPEVFYDAVESGSRLRLFGLDCEPSYLATLCHNEGLPEQAAWSGTIPVIIAGSENRYMAIAVDDVKQALDLVIRSLGAQFSTLPGVAGAATSADGQAIVALDLNGLVTSLSPEEQSSLAVEKPQQEHLLVLVVDDSRTQRLVSTSRFDSLGVETVTAENGQVALDFLNSTHRLPDVVLLDVEMPVKDGIQTLRDIRKNSRLEHLPVIMVTSRTGAKHRALAEQAGCNGYMGKPFNFPVLVEMIAELTSRELQLL